MIRSLRHLERELRSVLRRRRGQRLRRRLSRSNDQSYTSDYVSVFVPVWNRILEPIAGRAGVRLLEIGSYEGRSAVWFLQHLLTDPTSEIVCVDLFPPEVEARFDHNVRLVEPKGRLTKLKGRSHDLLPTLEPESFDVIYVDGGHGAATVLLDAMLSWKLLRPDGILIFDDYLWELDRQSSQRPQMAIDIFRSEMEEEVETLHEDYQVVVRKRADRSGRPSRSRGSDQASRPPERIAVLATEPGP